MKNFSNWTALVTGASGELGRAIAEELSRRGARVVLSGRRREPLEDAAKQLSGIAPSLWVQDLGDELCDVPEEIDIVVHNAMAYAPFAQLERVAFAEVESVLATGLAGVLRLNAALLEGMKRRGFGRLLHISSLAARTGAHGQAAYSTAKAGLEGLSRSLALEGGPYGITSNVLELGWIDTMRTRRALRPEVRQRLQAATPVGRAGTALEVARCVAFLVSEDAGFLTGATLPFNGGLGLGLFPHEPTP